MTADPRAALRSGPVAHVVRAANVEAAKAAIQRAHPKGRIGDIRCFVGEDAE